MSMNPIHYAILGDGRLARHMRHYFGLLGQPCSGWARNPASPFNSHCDPDAARRLRRTLAPASHVLMLVSDDALAPLLRRYPWLHHHTLVHCAGALSLPGVAGVHPLMTFAGELYPLAQYQRIPFLVEAGHDFDALFPGLPNPHHVVRVEHKALYHALCVMAGNFPQLLWQQVAARLQGQLELPAAVLEPYLRQVVDNFIARPEAALTGPLARGDRNTLQRNLAALEDDPLQAVYTAFSDLYQSMQSMPAWQEEAS